jgi:hypothetical protein
MTRRAVTADPSRRSVASQARDASLATTRFARIRAISTEYATRWIARRSIDGDLLGVIATHRYADGGECSTEREEA